jgi:hypothetical protein
MLMYKEKLCTYISMSPPPFLVAARWASHAWIEPAALLRQGVPSEDHHDCVFSKKGRRVCNTPCYGELNQVTYVAIKS